MKTSVKVILIFALFLVLQIRTAVCQEKKYENAPRVVLGSTEEMQTPEFWISRIESNPDRVMLTPEQIAALNKETANLRETVKKMKDINGESFSVDRVINYNDVTGAQYKIEDPLAIKSFPGDSLRARLLAHRKFFDSRTYYDHRQMKIDDFKKNEWYKQTNFDAIPDVITPKYGITTVHALNRVLPTHELALGRPDEWYIEGLQSTSADVAMPLAILHESVDNDWYYVRTETAFGWIDASTVAIATPEEIRDYVDADNFIVALAHQIPVYGSKSFDSFITHLYVGSKFRLIGKTNPGYHVLVPFRKSDGTLEIVDGWVKPDAKVSVGYQPLTQRNMINTLFNLLYRPYSWNDSRHEWNCCGFVRVVFRTFGIKTGNWPAFEMHYSNNLVVFPSKTPREKKYSYLDNCDPGLTLVGSDGHMNVFLGKVDGKPYVIHMGGYDYDLGEDTVMMYRRVNVNHTELEGGYNVNDWTKISYLKSVN
ncbi:MAG: SH3 domain-containing protein [Candidatus Latescibacteria bacterium]|nr:SH3 domain-containing protein [Candidatus Latescibacterota bacterium]